MQTRNIPSRPAGCVLAALRFWPLLMLLLLTLPAVVQAQFDYSVFGNDTIIITRYTGGDRAVPIPDYIDGYLVVGIGAFAFSGNNGLTSVTIPNRVTSIGGKAFYGCTSLTNVTIRSGPNSATYIENDAFSGCTSLTSATIPASYIGDSAFAGCTSLTSFTISASYIGPSAFAGTGLTTVTIGNGVTSIGNRAFYACTRLTSVTIPNSVTSIWDRAFYYCTSLTNVTIGNSVTSIGVYAFSSCKSLNAITVDALNPVISSVDGVLFNKSQTELFLFPEGKAGSYTIPNSVTSIGYFVFDSCTRLTSVTIPYSVTSIAPDAFAGCKSLSAITVDALNPVYSSMDGVVFNKSQTLLIQCPEGKAGSYTIPNSVTSIGDDAFSSCTSLTSVTIPNSVTNIGNRAFGACTNLASVTIGNSVQSIGYSAFYSCTNLTGVYFQGNAPGVDAYVFSGANAATVYYLPGTTGWGTTFAGRPAVLWNPRMATGDASFGVRTNRFGFTITGAADIPIVVEAATDLAHPAWVPLQSLNLTNGAFYFSDPGWTNYPARTYRLRSP